MTEKEMMKRTKSFALRVMKVVDALPRNASGRAIGGQLVRSSKAEFIAKLGIVEEEADESALWLELIMEGGLLKERLVRDLHIEAGEITAIVSASRKTARARLQIENRKSKIAN
ncbi:MAG: four helix bundle protein [Acidobacteria bacterium]|nr:MAG: four helix bundle protein [Acidobacteriota bacterium]